MVYFICQGESIEYVAIQNKNDGMFYAYLAEDIGEKIEAVLSDASVYSLAHRLSDADSDSSVGLSYAYSVFEARSN